MVTVKSNKDFVKTDTLTPERIWARLLNGGAGRDPRRISQRNLYVYTMTRLVMSSGSVLILATLVGRRSVLLGS